MKAYCIMLERNRHEAHPSLSLTCAQLHVDMIEVPAVDRQDLAPDDPTILGMIEWGDKPNHAPGSAGCSLSHEAVMDMAIEADEWPVMVLEEDAVVAHDAPARELRSAVEFARRWDAELLMLGGRPTKWDQVQWVGPNIATCPSGTYLTHAMVFWRSGALVYREALRRRNQPSDRSTWDVMKRGMTLIRLPQLLVQRPDVRSNITNRGTAIGSPAGRHDPQVRKAWLTEEYARDAWMA